MKFSRLFLFSLTFLIVTLMLNLHIDSTYASPASIAFVVAETGSLTDKETAIKSRVEGWGWTVTLKDDDAVADSWEPETYDGVIISQSVSSGKVTWMCNEVVGFLSYEGYIADDFDMATGMETVEAQTTINIVDNTHYVTSPYSTGNLVVSSSDVYCYATGWANDVNDLAQIVGEATQAIILEIDKDENGVSGSPVPERRVFYGVASHDVGNDLWNAAGWNIFDRAFKWVCYETEEGQDLTFTLPETVQPTATSAKMMELAYTNTETVQPLESLQFGKELPFMFSEAVSFSETSSAMRELLFTLSETVDVTASMTMTKELAIAFFELFETIEPLSNLVVTKELLFSFSQTVSIIESLSVAIGLTFTLSETTQPLATLSFGKEIPFTLSETIAFSESVSKAMEKLLVLSETVNVESILSASFEIWIEFFEFWETINITPTLHAFELPVAIEYATKGFVVAMAVAFMAVAMSMAIVFMYRESKVKRRRTTL